MGNEQVDGSIQATLEERGKQYGETWIIAGSLIASLHNQLPNARIWYHFAIHNWVQIFGKLIRAMITPDNPEHWRDIAGYAKLVLDRVSPVQAPVADTEDKGYVVHPVTRS